MDLSNIEAKIMAGVLTLVKPMLGKSTVQEQRETQERAATILSIPKNVQVMDAVTPLIPAQFIYPENADTKNVILYFHGGAYVAGSLKASMGIASRLADTAQLGVLSFEYRLAPEHPYPAALEDAFFAYSLLLDAGVEPCNIAFVGESAGGGLALATGLMAKEKGVPLPACFALMSPWTDVAMEAPSYTAMAEKDPILDFEALERNAKMYYGEHNPKDPYVSPLYGDFTGFPPVLVQVGTREMLLDDSRLLIEKMKAQGVDAALSLWSEMWHVFQAYGLNKSRQALEELCAFVNEKLNK